MAFALVAALSTLGVALLRAQRLLRLIERFRKGYILRSDVIELLGLLPGVASAAATVSAVTKLAEAKELARKADDLSERAERVGESLLRVVDEYARSGCGEDQDFAGS